MLVYTPTHAGDLEEKRVWEAGYSRCWLYGQEIYMIHPYIKDIMQVVCMEDSSIVIDREWVDDLNIDDALSALRSKLGDEMVSWAMLRVKGEDDPFPGR